MAIPRDYDLTLPFLKHISSGEEFHVREIIRALSKEFPLTDEELQEKHKSGERIFENYVRWAGTYLKWAEFVEATRWGYVRITSEGIKLLSKPPSKIDYQFLKNHPVYAKNTIRGKRKETSTEHKEELEHDDSLEEETPPEKRIDKALEEIETSLRQELLERILKLEENGKQFEKFVLKFLKAMDYGVEQRHLGQTGDHGVDGVVEQDRLGLDPVYIQAKQQQINDHVGEGVVRNFIGALDGKNANKGLIITTASFSTPAKDAAKASTKHIALIDGKELIDLMIQYNIGCQVKGIEIRELDEAFFLDEPPSED